MVSSTTAMYALLLLPVVTCDDARFERLVALGVGCSDLRLGSCPVRAFSVSDYDVDDNDDDDDDDDDDDNNDDDNDNDDHDTSSRMPLQAFRAAIVFLQESVAQDAR